MRQLLRFLFPILAALAFALSFMQLSDLSAFSLAYLDKNDPTAAAEVASWKEGKLKKINFKISSDFARCAVEQ